MFSGEPQRIKLAQLPTPLVRLENLGRELDGAQIWLKRDDLTGLELSGNKVRKLEYVLADAVQAGCDTIVTEGTAQSNHCRATAAACAKVGLKSCLLLRPEPNGTPVGNHLLDLLFGAETRAYPRPYFDDNREAIVAEVLADLAQAGRKPRWTPMGASEPLGCWGYIRCMAELAEQLYEAGVKECDVLLPISSCGTYAGALLGKLLHELDHITLWAVLVSDDVAYHTREVGRLCRATIEQFELPIQFDDARMQFIDGYIGDGYALPYPEAIAAIRQTAASEGVVLDPVYTGKAFYALLDRVGKGLLGRDRPAVFIHTGGIFSAFAWSDVLLPSV